MALVIRHGLGLEQRQLVRIAIQRQQAVADQIDCCLVAGAEQQDDVGGQLLVGELAAVFLGLHQLRRSGRRRASFAAARTAAGSTSRAIALPALPCSISSGVSCTGSSRRPPSRELCVERPRGGPRNAEHVADDRHRQAEREILDQVHLAVRVDRSRASRRRPAGCAGACPRPAAP